MEEVGGRRGVKGVGRRGVAVPLPGLGPAGPGPARVARPRRGEIRHHAGPTAQTAHPVPTARPRVRLGKGDVRPALGGVGHHTRRRLEGRPRWGRSSRSRTATFRNTGPTRRATSRARCYGTGYGKCGGYRRRSNWTPAQTAGWGGSSLGTPARRRGGGR